jgi:hypothetical protein
MYLRRKGISGDLGRVWQAGIRWSLSWDGVQEVWCLGRCLCNGGEANCAEGKMGRSKDELACPPGCGQVSKSNRVESANRVHKRGTSDDNLSQSSLSYAQYRVEIGHTSTGSGPHGMVPCSSQVHIAKSGQREATQLQSPGTYKEWRIRLFFKRRVQSADGHDKPRCFLPMVSCFRASFVYIFRVPYHA